MNQFILISQDSVFDSESFNLENKSLSVFKKGAGVCVSLIGALFLEWFALSFSSYCPASRMGNPAHFVPRASFLSKYLYMFQYSSGMYKEFPGKVITEKS